jgi:hypothetical protein
VADEISERITYCARAWDVSIQRTTARSISVTAPVAPLAGANHPYLGAGFGFLPRGPTGAGFVSTIHCFNPAAALSFGTPVRDVPSVVDQPRLLGPVPAADNMLGIM